MKGYKRCGVREYPINDKNLNSEIETKVESEFAGVLLNYQ